MHFVGENLQSQHCLVQNGIRKAQRACGRIQIILIYVCTIDLNVDGVTSTNVGLLNFKIRQLVHLVINNFRIKAPVAVGQGDLFGSFKAAAIRAINSASNFQQIASFRR